MITLKRFRRIEALLRAAGYGSIIDWSEGIAAPADADAFADQAIYVICNSGMSNVVAFGIYERCMTALRAGQSAASVFGHPGKRVAIDAIWADRHRLFEGYERSPAPLDYLRSLPWIGPVTAYHLAKNLGADVAKPDVHLERLAAREGTSTEKLCRRLARQTGYRVATIDTVLWRACADGLLDSKAYLKAGWKAAFRAKQFARDWISP